MAASNCCILRLADGRGGQARDLALRQGGAVNGVKGGRGQRIDVQRLRLVAGHSGDLSGGEGDDLLRGQDADLVRRQARNGADRKPGDGGVRELRDCAAERGDLIRSERGRLGGVQTGGERCGLGRGKATGPRHHGEIVLAF
jgi:hypothetical protein